MGFDRAGDGPGWVTVRVPTSGRATFTARVHRDTLTGRTPAMAGRPRNTSGNSGSDEQNLAAAAPDEDAAKESERRAEAADVTPHAQWRQERIDNAGEQNSPEAVAAEYGHVTYAPDDDKS